MGRTVGIDLGERFAVVATSVGQQAQVLHNRENRLQTPAVVGLRRRKGKKGDGATEELLVGDAALNNWELAPKDTVVSVRRLMGRGFGDPEVQRFMELCHCAVRKPADDTEDGLWVMIGDKAYSPVDVSAVVLKKLKEDAESRLHCEVSRAVITVPAYFGQIQRDATREAGLAAGFAAIKILDEPTAAAVAFGVEANPSSEPKYILIYDLGGGAFDVSVLMCASNVFTPSSLGGDLWLGGDNFDQLLIDRAVAHVKEEFGVDPADNKRFMMALRKVAQAAKERLGADQATDLIVPGLLQDAEGDVLDLELEVTRRDYETWASPLVARTMALVDQVLLDAGITAEQVDYVLMAGSAAAMPLVQQTVEARFGAAKMLRSVHPKHSVALGAAIVADRMGPSSPFAYWVQTAGDRFHRFIAKGDLYPTEAPATRTFYTSIPNQRLLSLPVYGGDQLDQASSNEKQGEAFAILPPGLPEETPLRFTLWLDQDGVFGLAARLGNGLDLNPWMLKGEADSRAVELLEQVEEALANRASDLPHDEGRGLADAFDAALEALRGGRFADALRRAERAQTLAVRAFPVSGRQGPNQEELRFSPLTTEAKPG